MQTSLVHNRTPNAAEGWPCGCAVLPCVYYKKTHGMIASIQTGTFTYGSPPHTSLIAHNDIGQSLTVTNFRVCCERRRGMSASTPDRPCAQQNTDSDSDTVLQCAVWPRLTRPACGHVAEKGTYGWSNLLGGCFRSCEARFKGRPLDAAIRKPAATLTQYIPVIPVCTSIASSITRGRKA